MIQLSKDHFLTIKQILEKYIPTSQVWFFGSRIFNEAKKYSDLDILVKHTEDVKAATMFYVKDELSESDIPFLIDLIEWDNTSPDFRSTILKNAISLEDLAKKIEQEELLR